MKENKQIKKEQNYYKTEQETIQYELFQEPQLEERNELSAFILSTQLKEAITSYLETVSSARIICELLLKNNGSPTARYISGKPKIYPYVCMFLDQLVDQGTVKLESKQDVTDRIYILI